MCGSEVAAAAGGTVFDSLAAIDSGGLGALARPRDSCGLATGEPILRVGLGL